ncbi:MAG: UDP-glucose--hexose-1-phosphate uridylyltransferase, partial [Lactobacillus sp.]|nr:UDP-glucose--hexose-1-phosphate uridylyltransferase [Lactobacillus sp.]
MSENNLVEKFITLIIAQSEFTELDRIYLRNRILALIGDDARKVKTNKKDLLDLKDELVKVAQITGKCAKANSAEDILG